MKTYLNLRTNLGVETVDELELKSLSNIKELRKEVNRLVKEYHIAGMPVYTSQRATKIWREKKNGYA